MAKRTGDDDLLGMFSSMNMSRTAKREMVLNKVKAKKPAEPKNCPIELMSQFLLMITENKMKEALLLTNQILEHEPNNKMILEYKTYLRQFIQQGLDVPEEEEEEEEDDDEDEEDDEDEGEGSDGDDHEEEEEEKPSSTSAAARRNYDNDAKGTARDAKDVYMR